MTISKNNDLQRVTKANTLVEAKYKLTALQEKFILLMVSYIQPDDDEFEYYKIRIKDIIEALEIKSNKRAYQYLRNAITSLQQQTFEIGKTVDGKERSLVVNWVASSEYFLGDGYVEFEFSRKLKPYLLDLKGQFTSFQLKNALRLDSWYSIRLYQLLKQYENSISPGFGKRKLKVEAIKMTLKIADKYKLYADFKRSVLETAKQEIINKTDLKFTYKEHKIGRKVDAIEFIITSNTKDEKVDLKPPKKPVEDLVLFPDEELDESPEVVKLIMQATEMKQRDAESIVNQGFDYLKPAAKKEAESVGLSFDAYVRQKLLLLDMKVKKDPNVNRIGFLKASIRDNYENTKVEKKRRESQRQGQKVAIERLERQRDVIIDKRDTERRRIIDDIIAKDPQALEKAFRLLLENQSFDYLTKTYYDDSLSFLDNYNKTRTLRPIVQTQIPMLYPEDFAPLSAYDTEIHEVQKEIDLAKSVG